MMKANRNLTRLAATLLCLLMLPAAVRPPAGAEQARADWSRGSLLFLGRYEQDNVTGNGPDSIAWRILDIQGDEALVVSEKVLDRMPYHAQGGEYIPVTWEESSLRQWLNGAFLQSAFDDREREAIAQSELANEDHPRDRTPGGSPTSDRVFLLSQREAERFFSGKPDRVAFPSAYAFARDTICGDDGAAFWWLRSPGMDPDLAVRVTSGGALDRGDLVTKERIGLRPAMKVRLSVLAGMAAPDAGASGQAPGGEAFVVGGTVPFGRYEQNGVEQDGPEEIQWRILRIEGRFALLISQHCLDTQPFHPDWAGASWEDSSLKAWLNGAFLNAAFGEDEQKALQSGVLGDELVFLLTESDAETYFIGEKDRVAINTPYAQAQENTVDESETGWWWLRTRGSKANAAMCVTSFGGIFSRYQTEIYSVRPAVWVNLETMPQADPGRNP